MVLVCSALYPFRLDLPRWVANDATRGSNGGLVFHGSGLAWTQGPPLWLDQAITTSALTVELDVESATSDPNPAVSIFSLAGDEWRANLAVEQEHDNLLVRLRRPGSTAEGIPHLTLLDVFSDGATHHIEVTIGEGVARVAVDGAVRIAEPVGNAAFTGWDPTYRLALGNEWVGTRAWTGTIRAAVVRVGDTRVDLLAPAALKLPDRWLFVPERLREPPAVDQARDIASPIFHGLGYAILVWLSVTLLRAHPRRAMLSALMLTTALGLGKILVAGRHPSLTDAGIEAAGAIIAGCIAMRSDGFRRVRS